MRSHSTSPLQPLLDELEADDAGDATLDPRVQSLLLTVHQRLTEPPDEVTRHHHLAAMRRTRRRARWTRRAGNVTRMGALAVVVVLVLAVAGLLPTTLQQTMADTAAVVGITLPTPGPTLPTPGPTPASEVRPGPPQPSELVGVEGDDEAEDLDDAERGSRPVAPTGR